jgi:5'(3')-deoxyribonucleotidase
MQKRLQAKLKIVYDVDDVLNNLNHYVFSTLKLGLPDRFNIMDCDKYIDEQKKAILGMYSSPDTFRKISYVPGASEICEIEKTGKAEIWINSHSFNEEILQVKHDSLVELLPEMNKSHIILTIGRGAGKKQLDNTDIIVEDSFTNLMEYSDDVLKVLINKTHNQAKTYGTTDDEQHIIRVKDLEEANEVCWRAVNCI